MAVRDYCWVRVICGHHVYKAIWMPEIGKILQCKQERGNPEDSYTVSVMKDDTIVGYVPHEKSHVMQYFIEHDGVVTCQVADWWNMIKALHIFLYWKGKKFKNYRNCYLQLAKWWLYRSACHYPIQAIIIIVLCRCWSSYYLHVAITLNFVMNFGTL